MSFVPAEDGSWVSEEFARLAEVIKDYDQWLELRWIPPDKRTRDDKKPYSVVDTRTNTNVFFASELDTPTDILARLLQADNSRTNVLGNLEAYEHADRILKHKAWLEQLEEAHDQAHFLVDSPLNTVTMNGKKFDDQRRVIGTAKGRKLIT